jgi:hypothetical protein
VDDALRCLLEAGEIGEGKLNAKTVRSLLEQEAALPPATEIAVAEVDLSSYVLNNTEQGNWVDVHGSCGTSLWLSHLRL